MVPLARAGLIIISYLLITMACMCFVFKFYIMKTYIQKSRRESTVGIYSKMYSVAQYNGQPYADQLDLTVYILSYLFYLFFIPE